MTSTESVPDEITDLNENSKKSQVDSGHVYFVATPIGNANDVSKRMIDTLRQVDIICAEDTRHTRNLLSIIGITQKKLLSHHEHNYMEQIPRIIELARNGSSIAIVSDAGTPGKYSKWFIIHLF
jgi:16S rRNA (cytidine1402-2'-O)-methyltransferase